MFFLSRTYRPVGVMAAALLLSPAPRPAHAAPDASSAAASAGDASDARATREERARLHFQAGLAAAQRGAWDEARLDFEAAYGLIPSLAVLFNLAGAQRRTGRLLSSHANYHRVATSGDAGLSQEQRRVAQRLADEVEALIPKLRIFIGGLTHGDRVVLDRQRIYGDELGRDLWLDPGEHTLRIERATAPTETRSVTLSEKDARVLSVRLP
ncbi:MAG: hypothetical protein RL385_5707 [Pseudomonadota bacterium]|jgi:hypothetical protein